MLIPGNGGTVAPQHIKATGKPAGQPALPIAEDPRFQLTPEMLKNAPRPEFNLAAL
ncbi:MAG: hypothetical protein AB7P76_11565 [Candidatus Melainabacteria bacterium]